MKCCMGLQRVTQLQSPSAGKDTTKYFLVWWGFFLGFIFLLLKMSNISQGQFVKLGISFEEAPKPFLTVV